MRYNRIVSNAELCKGSTADSDSVCLGSNPSSAANKKPLLSYGRKGLFERCLPLQATDVYYVNDVTPNGVMANIPSLQTK